MKLDILPLVSLVAFSATAATAATPSIDAPAAFAVGGREPVLTLQGIGAQVYQCKARTDGSLAWAFREPIAALMQDGRTVGRHFVGPTWELADGGVTGKAEASVPGASPDDIPALKLAVTDRHGGGPLTEAQVILRLHAVGGALTGPCERDGDLRSVPYKADYVFLK